MVSKSIFRHLLLAVCVFLIIQPALSSARKHSVPSHQELMSRAFSLMEAFISKGNESDVDKLRAEMPYLFSSALFEQALWKAIDRLSSDDHLKEQLAATPNVSAQCQRDAEQVLGALLQRNVSVISMIDAMGKPSPDLMAYNLNWPGALKECKAVTFRNTSFSPPQRLFGGQYCTAHIRLGMLGTFPLEVAMGICVPDSCSDMDIGILLNAVFYLLKIPLPQYAYAICQDPDGRSLDSLAIAGLVVVGVFLALMVVGTAVDLLYRYIPQWKVSRMNSLTSNHVDRSHDHLQFYSQPDNVLLLGQDPSKLCEPGLAAKALMAFSVYTNGAQLLSTEQKAGTLGCVHGVRFLSMTWVVLGHVYIFPITTSSNFGTYFLEVLKRWTFQAVLNASVSVDTFFVLSGLLVAYLGLKELKKNDGRVNWFKFYFHRFWRLTPPYMLIIFVYLSLGPYWGSGPMWIVHNTDRDNCKTYWWTNLLYINNFFSSTKVCLGQSWYLANDMQFYILSPLIFVPFYFSPIFGVVSTLVFMLATTIPPAAITMTEQLESSLLPGQGNTTSNSYFEDYYIKPYNRMGPYLIGMVTGYLLYRTNCKVRINKVVNLLCWAVATAIALAVLYGLYDTYQGHPITRSLQAFYNATARTAWGISVAWVIFACVTGNGGFVNTILSWKALIPLSRLTYCIYLLHIMILTTYVMSRDTTFYYSDSNVVMLFLGLLVVCYMVSAVVSLAFEFPMMALERLILPRKRD